MKPGTKRKLRVTMLTLLRMLDGWTEWMLIPSRKETIRRLMRWQPPKFEDEFWREYYASSV